MSSKKTFGSEALRTLLGENRLGEGEGLLKLYRWDRQGETPGIYLAQIDDRHATPSEIRAMTGGLASGSDANPNPLLELPCTLDEFMAFENCAGLFHDRLQDGRDVEDVLNEISALNEDAALLAGALLGVTTTEQTSRPDGPDRSMLADPDELIEAFGKVTGMSKAWFDKWGDNYVLRDAIKFKGTSGRGRSTAPLFCPFLVMQGLMKNPRKGSKRRAFINDETPWRKLKQYFPLVYEKHQGLSPLDD